MEYRRRVEYRSTEGSTEEKWNTGVEKGVQEKGIQEKG